MQWGLHAIRRARHPLAHLQSYTSQLDMFNDDDVDILHTDKLYKLCTLDGSSHCVCKCTNVCHMLSTNASLHDAVAHLLGNPSSS